MQCCMLDARLAVAARGCCQAQRSLSGIRRRPREQGAERARRRCPTPSTARSRSCGRRSRGCARGGWCLASATTAARARPRWSACCARVTARPSRAPGTIAPEATRARRRQTACCVRLMLSPRACATCVVCRRRHRRPLLVIRFPGTPCSCRPRAFEPELCAWTLSLQCDVTHR